MHLRVEPGREADYEAWLEKMTEGGKARSSGYRGVGFARQSNTVEPHRHAFHCDTLEHLKAFAHSDSRSEMLAEGADFLEGDPGWSR